MPASHQASHPPLPCVKQSSRCSKDRPDIRSHIIGPPSRFICERFASRAVYKRGRHHWLNRTPRKLGDHWAILKFEELHDHTHCHVCSRFHRPHRHRRRAATQPSRGNVRHRQRQEHHHQVLCPVRSWPEDLRRRRSDI